MSPSNNNNRFSPNETSSSDGLIVPFPELNDVKSCPRRSTEGRHGRKSHSNQMEAPTTTAPSAPISLPSSHIHRTPSELQLEQSLIQAEYSDVMMYTRLVRGMAEHGAVLHADRRGNQQGHVLSRKSLMGVVECRQRPIPEEGYDDDEAFHSNNHSAQAANANAQIQDTDSGWSISYSYEESQGYHAHPRAQSNINKQERQHSNATAPQEVKHCREVSGDSSHQAEEEDDDCVFSLEM